ncbi:hypothetical protein [Micromonospora sonneratiae]|uniref:Uncharacterized protein n=1 Tax=Micromonospora sonneratiae TaxID=1184706 RepID=A0ABW3Y9V5_9ACTN
MNATRYRPAAPGRDPRLSTGVPPTHPAPPGGVVRTRLATALSGARL